MNLSITSRIELLTLRFNSITAILPLWRASLHCAGILVTNLVATFDQLTLETALHSFICRSSLLDDLRPTLQSCKEKVMENDGCNSHEVPQVGEANLSRRG